MTKFTTTLPTQSEAALLDQALDLYRHGFSVIPVEYRSKVPLVAWKTYQDSRPTEKVLHYWFGDGSPKNLGLITGAVSGIVVLDVDSPDGLTGLDLPKTPTVRTGRGHHYYLRHHGFNLRNVQLPAIGDLRADGGIEVCPPSLHPNGSAYEWVVSLDQPLADMPQWLLAMICEPVSTHVNDNSETTEYGKAWCSDCDELAHKRAPGRNNLLNTVACKAGSLIASGELNEF